uniref:RRM domain-containing protein n=1 Tax=Oryza punctata TaxID=4537 RepID=A0A0E0M9I9_ORYPU
MADYGGGMMRSGQDSGTGVQARTKAHSRANQLQLKLIGQSHPTGLTANLLKLFEPRPPLEYKPPVEKRKLPAYIGMAQFVSQFVEPEDPEYAPPVPKGETRAEKKARVHQLKLEQGAAKVTEELQKYDPQNDLEATGDPYKTLFVARLDYETSEHKIKREFEAYGPIKRVRLVTDKITKKPRGYAFVEYMHTRDMKNAYKQADGRKVDSKRILVDVERGRTVPNWRPRRLGGGLGSSRISGEDTVQKHSASMLRAPDQRSLGLGGMIVMQIEVERNLVKGFGKEAMMRGPVSVSMTGFVIMIQGKRGTTIKTVRGLETGTKKEIVDMTVMIETSAEIMVRNMKERGDVNALMTAIGAGAGAGTGIEIMSSQVMNVTVDICVRGMLIMAMGSLSMTEIWLNMNKITAMRHMAMVKMNMELIAQSDMSRSTIVMIHSVKWQATISHDLTTQNLKPPRKVRHTKKVTTSITQQMTTRTET